MLPRQTRRNCAIHRTALTRYSSPHSALCLPQHQLRPYVSRRRALLQQAFRTEGQLRQHDLTHRYDRGFATAVDEFRPITSPFDRLTGSTLPSPFSPPPSRPYGLNLFDPTSLITIPEPSENEPSPRKNRYGISSDPKDALPVFEACMQLGKLERGALILQRLASAGLMAPEELIRLHNIYLRTSLQHLHSSPDRSQAEKLHRWYEMWIRSKGLPHTAETIACMIKASLLSVRGPRLERLIRRYMNMAPGEAGLDVLSRDDVLSDQDLAVVTDICPTYNYVTETDSTEELMANTIDTVESTANTKDSPISNMASSVLQELRPVQQRGEGLSSLKSNLTLLGEMEEVDLSTLPEGDRHEIQAQLERDSITAAISKWRTENKNLQKIGINTALSASSNDNSLSQDMARWMTAMESKIKEEFKAVEVSEKKTAKSERDLQRCTYGPLILQADPARLAAVTIITLLNSGSVTGMDHGIAAQSVIMDIAKVVQEDIELQKKDKARKARKRRKVHFTPDEKISAASHPADPVDTPSGGYLDSSKTASQVDTVSTWSRTTQSYVGAALLEALLSTAQIEVRGSSTAAASVAESQPAFSHTVRPRKGKKIGILLPHPSLLEKLRREPAGDHLAKHLPMLVEPKPWTRLDEGGFLESKTALVRVKSGDQEQKLFTKAAIRAGTMKQVFNGLDILGKTPWRVNKNVLSVMVEAWNSGEAIANMPPADPKLEIPPEPEASSNPNLRHQWMREVSRVENLRSGLHSQRCFMNLQLEIARAYRNQKIYFPHNIDYRGRAYPMPTYLNHMGADHARGLLKFADGKELGERGLRWLKIHLANLYGLDKASFDDREAFANDNKAMITESATNPLGGSRWWLKADDPWQCLSACFELKAAWELEDPTKFVSSLPVHQDGTCNGLQHYAALGGDTWGAQQVNLEPGDRPADVYSAVAGLVKERIAEDIKKNNEFAKIMQGKVTRKVVKQTVMTNVYGVTFAGAKKQVCKQLDALYPNLPKESGVSNIVLATYVARHVFAALATMFRGAHDIQYWLGEIGGRVCRALTPSQLEQLDKQFAQDQPSTRKSAKATASTSSKQWSQLASQFRSTVVWTTPLRMPVVQPYRKSSMSIVRTCLQSLTFPKAKQTDPVNRRKQLQGFPPNFIHSLDATHMLLSALQCNEMDLTFAAVHDSFWTHAGDVDKMNGVIRDAFIKIHEENVIGRLASEFEARHTGSVYLAHIDPDTPVAAKIRELRSKSKLSPTEELLLEHKRSKLKLSGTPWDLEAANQIVTPASVYEEMQAQEHDMLTQAEMEETALGSISDSELAANKAEIEAELSTAVTPMSGQDEVAESSDKLVSLNGQEMFKQIMFNHHQPEKKKQKSPLMVWLPLTIPSIPQKGDFDVSRLRESKYFFS